MSTLRTTASPKKEVPSVLSRGLLSNFSARNRHQAYNVVVQEFKKSGLTQAELASRIEMDPALLSRILARPRNIELDTLSKLICGMSGAALTFATAYPSNRAENAEKLYQISSKALLKPSGSQFATTYYDNPFRGTKHHYSMTVSNDNALTNTPDRDFNKLPSHAAYL